MASSGWVGRERNGLRAAAADAPPVPPPVVDEDDGRSDAVRFASLADWLRRPPREPEAGRFDILSIYYLLFRSVAWVRT
jgi:hypothetical protein